MTELASGARLQLMEEAAQWLQRMRDLQHDESLVEEWLDWCQRDPRHQQAFDELAGIWEITGQLDAGPVPVRLQPQPGSIGRRALAASLAGLGLAAVLGAAWWTTHATPGATTSQEFASAVGVNSTQTLADGSRLDLGGATRVTVAIGPRERRVDLHTGELFVMVHHEAARKFSVDAGRLSVIATGTAFNVLRTAERTTVTVVEGSVDALYEGRAAAPNVQLLAGQQLVYSHASHSVVVREANTVEVTAWRNGWLHFNSQPLSEVITSINRYASRPIVIEDPQLQALSFTGTARTDRIDGWLQALPHVFPVAIVQRTDGSHLIGSRADTNPD